MKTYGLRLQEGSTLENLAVPSGTVFPNFPDEGEIFYRTDESDAVSGLYVYSRGDWRRTTNTISAAIPIGPTLPNETIAGDLFFRTTDNSLYVYGIGGWMAASAFNGTVTSVDISAANGFTGTVADPNTTPVISIGTTVNGILKGSAGGVSAAVVRTDYAEPTGALSTGILKNTTGTGAHSIAVPADFPILNQDTTGNAATVTTNANLSGDVTSIGNTTTYNGVVPISKGGTGQSTAPAALNALLPDQGTHAQKFLQTNGSTTSWAAAGTVSSVAIQTANGVSGTVLNPTTTPVITLTLGDITPSSVAATGTVTGSNLSGVNTGDQTAISGNAGTATAFQTPRTISVDGDGTGTSAPFDGTANAIIPLVLSTVNVSPQTDAFRKITVNGKGLVTNTSAVTNADIVASLGFTPYNSTNPAGYTSNTGTVMSVGLAVAGTHAAAMTASTSPVSTSGNITLTPNLFSATTSGVVPASGGGTLNFLRADGAWTVAGTGTVTSVNLTAPAAGISVSGGPITTAGSITLALTNDLAAVEALTSTGIVRRTGTDTWSAGTPISLATEVTGNLPITSLNGGTGASGTTFWRGDGTWGTPPSNPGTVTSVSIVSANGFTGTVGTPTSTPAITLGTSVSGLLKGNGTAISAAIPGTDYLTVLSGDGTTAGNVLTLSTVNTSPQTNAFRKITVNGKGLVTETSAVTSSDIISSLGYTPYNGATNPAGYTSNAGTVTSVNLTAPAAGISISGGPITTSGTIALSLTNDLAAVEALTGTGLVRRTGTDTWTTGTPVALASEVTGVLPIANGGTGQTTEAAAINALLPAQAGQAGRILTSNGTTAAWTAIPGITTRQMVSAPIGQLTTTAIILMNNTVPLITEGVQLLTLSITPGSTSSKIIIHVSMTIDTGNSNRVAILTVFRGSVCVGSAMHNIESEKRPLTMTMLVEDLPNRASEVTYQLRVGLNSASTLFINQSKEFNMGGATRSAMVLTEIF